MSKINSNESDETISTNNESNMSLSPNDKGLDDLDILEINESEN